MHWGLSGLKLASLLLLIGGYSVFGQKGVDTQTQKIKEESNKVIRDTGSTARSIDWGKGKTPVRGRLANPYKLNARRDVLVQTITDVLKERKIIVDEASSRLGDGIIVTQPYVFAKGPVMAQSELTRYGVLTTPELWTRGQYSLMIEVQSIDGIQNNVFVNAKVEGRAGNGVTSEWVTVESSGVAEDEFLVKLIEAVTGNKPDAILDIDQ